MPRLRSSSIPAAFGALHQDDFIRSVANALQNISYYHPVDYITNLARAYELEKSPAAKDVMAQILINSSEGSPTLVSKSSF